MDEGAFYLTESLSWKYPMSCLLAGSQAIVDMLSRRPVHHSSCRIIAALMAKRKHIIETVRLQPLIVVRRECVRLSLPWIKQEKKGYTYGLAIAWLRLTPRTSAAEQL